jgi:DNA-binding CsgD family transcriptional regulator
MRRVTIRMQAARPTDLYVLSRRENQILRLVCRGMPNIEIAHTLSGRSRPISEATVRTHLNHMFAGAEVNNRGELAAWSLMNPDSFAGFASPPGLHPEECDCHSPHCTAMRIL